MSRHKFKVGDRVRIAKEVCHSYPVDTGVVLGTLDEDGYYRIMPDQTNEHSSYWQPQYLFPFSIADNSEFNDENKRKEIL